MNNDGPTLSPNQYPTWSPRMAAMGIPMRRAARLRWTFELSWVAANRPAVTSSESPGRKKPKNRPDSAKMMA